MESETFGLKRLCELAGPGVTARTVRYYVQRHLLPRPAKPGRGAAYGPGHLNRLRLVRLLRREHLPLEEIRMRLAPLTDAQVGELLREQPRAGSPPGRGGAMAGLRQVLSAGVARRDSRAAPGPGQHAIPVAPEPAPPVPHRTRWERIVLTREIELHARRPLTRDGTRHLERLLAAARRILDRGRTR